MTFEDCLCYIKPYTIMQKLKFEYRITLGYLIIGGSWIIFSDKLLKYFINNPDVLTRFQTYKGWFYVIITAILFYIILEKHLVRLRNAEQKAKESDRLKTAFLQNISHEIRTPMNGIIGFADLLNEGNLTEQQKKEYLEIITQSSNQLLNIVNEVLDISMIETGNTSVNLMIVHLNNLLEEIYSTYRPFIKQEIFFSISKGLPDHQSYILTDKVKIKQVLTNLLDNAKKFTNSGHIKFGYHLVRNELEFFVEDTGIGISEDLHDEIFSRFHKSSFDNSRIYEGVGLGLAICKGYIELLKGKMWLKSESFTGSTFYFTIPYLNTEQNEKETDTARGNSNKFNDLVVLIAEDDESNYLYISNILKDAQIDFYYAKNGKEAVEICKNNKDVLIVLMDLKMPLMNGYEAAKLIKESRPGTYLIAQTAYAMVDEREKALSAGFDDYLAKPFRRDELLSLIKNHYLSEKQ
jgi:signal transduction histidine kinase/CheY-like chemotaxis protein